MYYLVSLFFAIGKDPMKVRFITDEKTNETHVIERIYQPDGRIDEHEIDPQQLVGLRLHWNWECCGDQMFEFVPVP